MTVKPPPGLVGYLLIGQVLIPAVINLVINLLFGFSATADRTAMPLWTVQGGAVADWIATSVLLPFITCLIATPIVRRQVRNGTAPHFVTSPVLHRLSRVASLPLLAAALIWATLGAALCAGPVFAIASQFREPAIPVPAFLIIKCSLAVLLGAMVTPLIAMSVIVCGQSNHQVPPSNARQE